MPDDYRILIVLSSTRYSRKIVEAALAEARQNPGAGLSAVYVVESKELEKVYTTMEDVAFLGTKPAEELKVLLLEEHRRLGEERLREVVEMARAEGVALETRLESGDYGDLVIRAAEPGDFDVIFLTRSGRSFLARLAQGSEVDKVVRFARQTPKTRVNIVKE